MARRTNPNTSRGKDAPQMRAAGRAVGQLPAHRILIGLAGLAVAGVVVLAVVLWFGMVTVSARPPHMAVTHDLLHHVFKANVSRRAQAVRPPERLDDEGLIALGAQHFAGTCASCHGGPGLGQSPLALSMRPRPQHLPSVVGQFSDEELYVILRDGVRFSAMPAWPADGNFDEIWSVVAFLRQLPEMDAATYAALTATPEAEGTTAIAWSDRGDKVPLDVGNGAPPLDEYAYAAPGTGWRPIGLSGDPLGACSGCHGADGSGAVTGGNAPNLSIQSADYLEAALTEYATGERESGKMSTVATALSRLQMEALAAHYAELPATPAQTADASPELVARGRDIALGGDTEAALPACVSCHGGEAGRGGDALPLIPALAGQNAAYLERRLLTFTEGRTGADNTWRPMHAVAGRMAPEDRKAVAAYFATLPPGSLPAASHGIDGAGAGETVTEVCAKCHTQALTGVATGEYPNLTLQTATYAKLQLASFRSKLRESSRMSDIAGALSPEEIDALAAYIGAQPATQGPAAKDRVAPTPERIAMARTLAEEGDPERDLPACNSCHSAEATAALPVTPRLNGQNANYLEHRLSTWRSRDPETTISAMPAIASALSEDERAALADWYAEKAPLPKE